MFERLLIANRGEIACRIARTARRLGIKVIAVYSDADADAQHVLQADEAHRIGPAPAAESYLNIPAVIAAAVRAGAEAIHPGYGFLSENAAFAEACMGAGIRFVGPPAAAIRAMGEKAAAKALMEAAGVPVVPGYHGADQDPARLAEEARAIGYPVAVKAVAGGGGRGLRMVPDAESFAPALAAARREALAAFGSDRVLIETWVATPRHIEFQVFADAHGNALHLFERDCSIQRRHQKVFEEAPAPGLSPALRTRMGAAAVAAARAVGYEGAGTVEFIVDAAGGLKRGAFYFMEMNTRLQVEHPVTECVTGLDLVEWQLRVAAGEPLPLRQEDVRLRGHAIEARLYAEDPDHDFLPTGGLLRELRFPTPDEHLRIDAGYVAGDVIGAHYDAMIAKVIAWHEDRPSALRRLCAALDAIAVDGVRTNVSFLSAVAGLDDFAKAHLDTGFIARNRAALAASAAAPSDTVVALAALAFLLGRAARARADAAASSDPHSPWHLTTGWRLNGALEDRLDFEHASGMIALRFRGHAEGFVFALPGGLAEARGTLRDGMLSAEIAGVRRRAQVLSAGATLTLSYEGESHRFAMIDPLAAALAADAPLGQVRSPLPGKVIAVLIGPGAAVKKGDPLIVVEAMKMEHTVRAPEDGTVERILYEPGEAVAEGVDLVRFTAATARQ
ncbi:MAG: ATP-grasp domain-containing protein [Alphaproteobacteria bacterium]|nr:ATP-grasp domain-containing protein [Alphaproteobacteria bacterium]